MNPGDVERSVQGDLAQASGFRTRPRPARLPALAARAAAVLVASSTLASESTPDAALPRRVPWTTSRVVGTPDPPLPFVTRPCLPHVELKSPVFVIAEPGTRNVAVVLQGGDPGRPSRVVRVQEDQTSTQAEPFLEIPGRLVYSVAFHPGYTTNGFAFVFSNGRTGEPERTNQIQRVTVQRQPPWAVVPGSERVLIEWRSGGHDGGGMGFGPDGLFYASTGDGSNDSDTWDSGQTVNDLLGAVLRIDVDRPDPGRAYGIPQDNPFVALPGARGELWAYGLRNPWRLSVDAVTGQVWVGNNGQDLWETAHLVRRGENYGWSVFEGSHLFYRNRRRGPTPVVPPTFEHHHSEARSLTGGVVVRGGRLPALEGAYVYGDHSTGRIWAGLHDGSRVAWHREVAATPHLITSFGLSHSGELLLTDLGGGLHQVVAAKGDGGGDGTSHGSRNGMGAHGRGTAAFPRRLSETGVFASTRNLAPAPGVVAYSVNAPGWADGAEADRLLGLPGDTRITHAENRGWGLPDGAVVVQTLWFPGAGGSRAHARRVESRLLTRQDGRWAGYSYRWNADQTDADLVPAAGMDAEVERADADAPGGFRRQRWRFPSRSECLGCHSRAAGFVLGLSDVQMHRDHVQPGGRAAPQIQALADNGFFADPAPKAMPKAALVDPFNPAFEIERRARSYLHANCAPCHVEAGGGNARMQLEFVTARDRMEVLGARPQHDTFGLPDAMLVAPGAPDRSVLLHRVSARGRGQMPPIVSQAVDTRAVALLREWIARLPPGTATSRPWKTSDFAGELESLPGGRSPSAGKASFKKVGCNQCHRIEGEGGSVGPDLSHVGQRSRAAAILESILDPSRVIAPEHALAEIETVSGETWVGRVESESNGTVVLRPAGADEAVVVKAGDVRARRVHPVSGMPAGMVDALARDEVLDLVAYLMAGSAR